jgi:hypothetical protein
MYRRGRVRPRTGTCDVLSTCSTASRSSRRCGRDNSPPTLEVGCHTCACPRWNQRVRASVVQAHRQWQHSKQRVDETGKCPTPVRHHDGARQHTPTRGGYHGFDARRSLSLSHIYSWFNIDGFECMYFSLVFFGW